MSTSTVWQEGTEAEGIAVLCRALLANESLEEAETAIAKVRDIDLQGLWQDRTIAEWMASMKRTSMVGQPLPSITGFMATARSHTHLMVTGGVLLCHHKQQAEKATDRLTQPLTTTDEWEAAACTVQTSLPGLSRPSSSQCTVAA